jgi:hypothetical protein
MRDFLAVSRESALTLKSSHSIPLDSRAQVTAQFAYYTSQSISKASISSSGPFTLFDETPGFFLTWKYKDFYLYLDTSDLNLIPIPVPGDFNLWHKLCEAESL